MSASRPGLASGLKDCPCAGKTLERLIQPAILAVLAREELHGYGIVKQIARMPTLAGREPDAAGVYRSLKSMQKRRLVVSSWHLPEAGPAKRLYRLTKAGEECLSQWVRTLAQYRNAVGGLLTAARKARSAAVRARGRGAHRRGKLRKEKG